MAISEKFANKITEYTNRPFTKETWWEIAAYAIRLLSCIIPAGVILYLENSWYSASIGLIGGLAAVSAIIILWQPIKAALKFIPGVVPFGSFVAISIMFTTMAEAFLIVGISGLAGSVIAIPFHYKYLCSLHEKANAGVNALRDIASKLDELTRER